MKARVLSLLFAAAVIWAAAMLLPGESEREESPARTAGEWPRFSVEEVRRVAIHSPAARYVMRKEDGEWFVYDHGRAPEEETKSADATQAKGSKEKTGPEQTAGPGRATDSAQAEEPDHALGARSGNGSRVGESIQAPRGRVDMMKLRELVGVVADNPPMRRLGALGDSQAATYGLDKPVFEISIKKSAKREAGFDAPETWRLRCGVKNPAGDGVYATTMDGGELLLVPAAWQTALENGPEYYHDLRIFPIEPERTRRVRLEKNDAPGDKGWELERVDQGWRFTWPEELTDKPVDANVVDQYLFEITSLEGERYIAPDEAPAGATTASLTLEAEDKANKNGGKGGGWTAVIIGPGGVSRQPRVVSDWQPRPFVLDASKVETLARDAFSLRDRRVVSIPTAHVDSVTLAAPGEQGRSLVAERREQGWFESGSDRELVGFDMLLWRLSDLAYQAEPRDSEPGGVDEILRLIARDNDGRVMRELVFHTGGDLPENSRWVHVIGERHWIQVDAALSRDMLARLSPREGGKVGGQDGETKGSE